MESSLARFEESSEKLSLKPDNEHSFESWKLKIDELNNAINEYRNKITELQNKDGIIDKEDISEATELENKIKSLQKCTVKSLLYTFGHKYTTRGEI